MAASQSLEAASNDVSGDSANLSVCPHGCADTPLRNSDILNRSAVPDLRTRSKGYQSGPPFGPGRGWSHHEGIEYGGLTCVYGQGILPLVPQAKHELTPSHTQTCVLVPALDKGIIPVC